MGLVNVEVQRCLTGLGRVYLYSSPLFASGVSQLAKVDLLEYWVSSLQVFWHLSLASAHRSEAPTIFHLYHLVNSLWPYLDVAPHTRHGVRSARAKLESSGG